MLCAYDRIVEKKALTSVVFQNNQNKILAEITWYW